MQGHDCDAVILDVQEQIVLSGAQYHKRHLEAYLIHVSYSNYL